MGLGCLVLKIVILGNPGVTHFVTLYSEMECVTPGLSGMQKCQQMVKGLDAELIHLCHFLYFYYL